MLYDKDELRQIKQNNDQKKMKQPDSAGIVDVSTPFVDDDEPAVVLKQVFTQYGTSIIDDPKRIIGLVLDMCSLSEIELNVLELVLETKIIHDCVLKGSFDQDDQKRAAYYIISTKGLSDKWTQTGVRWIAYALESINGSAVPENSILNDEKGNQYEGELMNGIPHGKGTFFYTDGRRYEGSFVNGMRNGHGITYFTSGNRYEGEYKDDKKNGFGKVYFANGDRYEGEFKDDKKNGFGKVYFANGERYEGEFKDDKRNGFGKCYFANGERYEGEYKDDKRNGFGKYYYANGDRYEGEFKDGKMNGFGKVYFANGERYEGEYKDDKKNGFGKYYYADGTCEEVVYNNGILVSRQ